MGMATPLRLGGSSLRRMKTRRLASCGGAVDNEHVTPPVPSRKRRDQPVIIAHHIGGPDSQSSGTQGHGRRSPAGPRIGRLASDDTGWPGCELDGWGDRFSHREQVAMIGNNGNNARNTVMDERTILEPLKRWNCSAAGSLIARAFSVSAGQCTTCKDLADGT